MYKHILLMYKPIMFMSKHILLADTGALSPGFTIITITFCEFPDKITLTTLVDVLLIEGFVRVIQRVIFLEQLVILPPNVLLILLFL